MAALFHRDLTNRPSEVTDTNSARLYLKYRGGVLGMPSDGVFDLSSGAGVTCLGYGVREIKDAMIRQIEYVPYVHSGNWTTKPAEELAERVLEHAGWTNGGVYFLNTGAEAVEACCKLAMQYFWEEHPDRLCVFWGRNRSYHGNTIFTLNLGGHPLRRADYYRSINDAPNIDHFPSHTPSSQPIDLGKIGYRSECLALLKSRLCSGSVVVVETIAGTTVGIEPPDVEYLVELRRLCTAREALLIYDEVLCGNFRTGHLFSWQYFQNTQTELDLAPDLIAIGKGLSGGYFPLSAVVANEKVMERIRGGSKRLWHSTTNQNHPIGCAAGIAALKVYQQSIHQITELAAHLGQEVIPRLMSSPHVHKVTGKWNLLGIHLDQGNPGLHKTVKRLAAANGVSIYTEGGTLEGGLGNFILLAPPYCASAREVDQIIEKLLVVIDKAVEGDI